eukprot:scaffold6150_cov181-Alexandrium_tamarense.AAC.3
MTSREEFTAFLQSDPQSGFHQNYGSRLSPVTVKQTHPFKAGTPPKSPSKPSTKLPLPTPPMSEQLKMSRPAPSMADQLELSRGHGRSRSDFVWAAPASEPSHPLKQQGLPPTHQANRPRSSNKPPLRALVPQSGSSAVGGAGGPIPPPPPQSVVSPVSSFYHTPLSGGRPPSRNHRRAKSDIPHMLNGNPAGRLITKTDLLKNFPDPRWGGRKPELVHHARKRTGSTGSDAPLLDDISTHSAGGGYGSTSFAGHPLLGNSGFIGSVDLPKKMHSRTRSDASMASVTTNMAKSALFRDVTEKGTIRLQLPKDNFRILMDSALGE